MLQRKSAGKDELPDAQKTNTDETVVTVLSVPINAVDNY
jgi:hypothetical protein